MRRPWHSSYVFRLVVSDLVVIAVTVSIIQFIRLGEDADIASRNPFIHDPVSYWFFSAFLIVLWVEALAIGGAYSRQIAGAGLDESRRLVTSSFVLFSLIAIFAYLSQLDIARSLLLAVLPVGLVLLVIERWFWRQWLSRQREAGRCLTPALLIGSQRSVLRMAEEVNSQAWSGYQVAGMCTTSRTDEAIEAEVPVFEGIDNVDDVIAEVNPGAILITSSEDLDSTVIQKLSWDLDTDRELLFGTSVTGIAGPRIRAHAIAGLPLISAATPHLSGGQKAVKRAFDVVSSAVLIVLLSPVMVAVALAVKLTSSGPILFSHERVGQEGRLFKMHKFRSMRQGADSELQALLEEQNTAGVPLFKVKDDPRITPVGKFIRKFSLDELPQLFNVLGGSMSLVGPRPQVVAEVALYTDAAHRRLMLRPGITGLWQVSGRSELDWDQAIMLDLYYVENWSLASDIGILVKTVKAVVAPGETAH